MKRTYKQPEMQVEEYMPVTALCVSAGEGGSSSSIGGGTPDPIYVP